MNWCFLVSCDALVGWQRDLHFVLIDLTICSTLLFIGFSGFDRPFRVFQSKLAEHFSSTPEYWILYFILQSQMKFDMKKLMKNQHYICCHTLRHCQLQIPLYTLFKWYCYSMHCLWPTATKQECKWQYYFHRKIMFFGEVTPLNTESWCSSIH